MKQAAIKIAAFTVGIGALIGLVVLIASDPMFLLGRVWARAQMATDQIYLLQYVRRAGPPQPPQFFLSPPCTPDRGTLSKLLAEASDTGETLSQLLSTHEPPICSALGEGDLPLAEPINRPIVLLCERRERHPPGLYAVRVSVSHSRGLTAGFNREMLSHLRQKCLDPRTPPPN